MESIRSQLIAKVRDETIVEYFALRSSLSDIVKSLQTLEWTLDKGFDRVPFNASVKGYHGAIDSHGHSWIIKPLLNEQDALHQRLATLSYLIDFQMSTLSAPTGVIAIGGKRYRASKVVPSAMQISSYDYLVQPFKNVLLSDLVNRWLQFDEDRNPNNYMVIQNSVSTPLVVAIDFDKADFESEEMKITGTEDKFGWIRHEKNRYLTLFKSDHFEGVPISVFDGRLRAMMAIDLKELKDITADLLQGYCPDPVGAADKIMGNLEKRRQYIDGYFRKWLKEVDQEKLDQEIRDYSGMGRTFMKIYQEKK